jgi:hypothetical protein
MRALGHRQLSVLRTLAQRNGGVWYPGCGWTYGTLTNTAKILDSLVKRGYATMTPASLALAERYTITDTGRALVTPGFGSTTAPISEREAQRRRVEAQPTVVANPAQVVDLQADLQARWRPSGAQIKAAADHFARGFGEPLFTIHLLVNKRYGVWTEKVQVVDIGWGGSSERHIYGSRSAALEALEKFVALREGTDPVTGGYTTHWKDGEWAVFEDICSVKNQEVA